jgi:hypothetical protein
LNEEDENIVEAMHRLHSPTRGSNEASDKFNARIAASQRLHKDIEDSHRAEWKRLCQQEDLRAKVKRLCKEQELYEIERKQRGAVICNREPDRPREDARPGGEMRRREHYREWLTTQVILDTMHEGDITEYGFSNIPT